MSHFFNFVNFFQKIWLKKKSYYQIKKIMIWWEASEVKDFFSQTALYVINCEKKTGDVEQF